MKELLRMKYERNMLNEKNLRIKNKEKSMFFKSVMINLIPGS